MPDITQTIKFDFDASTATYNGVINKVKEVGKVAKEAQKAVEGNVRKMIKSFGDFSLSINSTIQLIKQIGSLVSKPLTKAGQFQTMQMSLEVLLGSTEKAQQRLKELSDFTKGTSFELPEVVKASKELQSLGKYSKEILTMLSNMAIGSGKSLDQITNAYTALVKGEKNQATELFRDIGITTEDFVKATGKGIDTTTGMITASSKEMLDALEQIVKDRNFEVMIEKQSQTFEGMMGNLKDGFNQVITDMGMVFLPLAKQILEILLPAIEFLKNNIKTLTLLIAPAAVVFAAWSSKILLTSVALKTIIPIIRAFSVALISSPIGLVIGGLALLTGAIFALKSAGEEATEKLKEKNEAELESIKTQKDSTEAALKHQESNKKLLDAYIALEKQPRKTTQQLKQLKEIGEEINKKYPGLIANTKDYTGSLNEVERQAKKTAIEVSNLTNDMIKLQDQQGKSEREKAKLAITKEKENLIDEMTNALSGFFKSSAKESEATNFFKGYFDNIVDTIDFSELDKIKDKVMSIVKFKPEDVKLSPEEEKVLKEVEKQVKEFRTEYMLKGGANAAREHVIGKLSKDKKEIYEEAIKNQDKLKLFKATSDKNQTLFKDITDNEMKIIDESMSKLIEARKKHIILEQEATSTGKTTNPEPDKPTKTKLEKLNDGLKALDDKFEYEKLLLERNISDKKEYYEEVKKLEDKYLEDIGIIRNDAEKLIATGNKDALSFSSNIIKKENQINKERADQDQKYWNELINNAKNAQELLELARELGLKNTEQYIESMEKQLANMNDAEFTALQEKLKRTGELTKEELSRYNTHKEARGKIIDEIVKAAAEGKKQELTDLASGLEKNKELYQDGEISLENYRKFLLDTLDKLSKDLDKPEYKGILDKLITDDLGDDVLEGMVNDLKKNTPALAGALDEIVQLYKKAKDEIKEVQDDVTADQQFFGDILVTSMDALTKGLGEALASGFGKEGFKKLSQNLFEGFKSILTQTLDFIEKEYLLAGAKSLVDAVLNPGKAALDGVALIGAEVALQTAKAAINAWTPKFALGGGVTGPTYLMAGENNKKEYIISPNQMKNEVRSLLKTEFKYYYHPQQTKQVVEVRMQPVELKQKGRDMYGVIRQQERLEGARKF